MSEQTTQQTEDAIVLETQTYSTKGEAQVAVIQKDFYALFEGSDMKKHLASLKGKYSKLKIASLEDVKTYEDIKKAISVVRPLRTGLEKKSKELKEDAQAYIKEVNKQEKFIQDEIAKIEDPLWAEREKFEQMQKDEEARKEKEAQERYDSRMAELKTNGLKFDGEMYSIREVSIDAMFVKNIDDEKYNSLLEKVKVANSLNLKEEEEKRIAEEQRLKVEQEEKRKVEEARLENERIQNELKKQQEDLKRQMEEFEANKKRMEDEKRKEEERKEYEKQQQLKAEKEAEEKRIAKEKLDAENKIIAGKAIHFNGVLNYDFPTHSWDAQVGQVNFKVTREQMLNPDFDAKAYSENVKLEIENESKRQEKERQLKLDDSQKLKEYISQIMAIEIPTFNNVEVKNKVVGILGMIQKIGE